MKSRRAVPIDIEVDDLTSSIIDVKTGEILSTIVVEIAPLDNDIDRQQWSFDWAAEFLDRSRSVYKLISTRDPGTIQGLISPVDNNDHIFVNLIESASFNRGNHKEHRGVAGNLFAFACKCSFESGYNGVVAFISKTQLIEHYQENIGAKLFKDHRMFLDVPEASNLVRQYFKDFDHAGLL
jgi:hypothetical protein